MSRIINNPGGALGLLFPIIGVKKCAQTIRGSALDLLVTLRGENGTDEQLCRNQ